MDSYSSQANPNQINYHRPEPTFVPQATSGFTQKEIKTSSLSAWLKLGYIIGFLSLSIIAAFFFAKKISANGSSETKGDIILNFKYQPVLWKDFGNVFEPLIKIPIYYPKKGFTKQEFLLDSGAVVSSLPREKAHELGFLLSRLPRSVFAGFGNTTSFAYKASLKIKLGKQEVTIPVVFTENQGTKAILGRSGFFENYSVYFNSKTKKIEIRKWLVISMSIPGVDIKEGEK